MSPSGFNTTTGKSANAKRLAFYEPRDLTRAASQGFMAKFEREVDPLNELPLAERERRALALRRSHMLKLAALSAKKRAEKACLK